MIITDSHRTFIIDMQEIYNVNREGSKIILICKNGRCFSFSKPSVDSAIKVMNILSENDWKSLKVVTI